MYNSTVTLYSGPRVPSDTRPGCTAVYSDMKVPVYVCWQLWFVTCALVRTVNTTPIIPQDVKDIISNIYVKQKFCGQKLPVVLSMLCEKHNGEEARPRSGLRIKRQLAKECCYQSCSYFYIMKHYCEKTTVSLDDIPEPHSLLSTSFEMTDWAKKNTIPVERDAVTATEDGAQGKPAENKIRKLHIDSTGTVNRPPARLGVIMSTRPPIIYTNRYKLTPAASNRT
ncbi:hypothetical protein CBL_05491 [Carabus blaptoides fortunei]